MATIHLEIAGIDVEEKKINLYKQEAAYKKAIEVAAEFGLEAEVYETYIKFRESGELPAAAYNAALFEWDL